MTFDLKDSGVRKVFDSGMVRDVTDDKTDYTLALDGPMFDRWAEHLTKGAVKYDARNWMKAAGKDEHSRFKQSALRHFLQWFRGEQDEDHAAAVFFNINGAEYVAELAEAFSAFEDDMCVNCVTPWKCNGPHLDGGQYGPGGQYEPDVSGCDGCAESCGFCYDADLLPVTAKVGDVDANDILDAISQPGGAGDLAEDYNYLRNRVAELSSRFDAEYPSANDPRVSDPDEFNGYDDGGW